MLYASYTATRSGLNGLANRAIRQRFGGSFFKDGAASHCEVVFLPGDGVDQFMPDGTCEPGADGSVWCAGASATDVMPEWSKKRAGKTGGVRFKRIILEKDKWELLPLHRDPLETVVWFKNNEGYAYDWGFILGWVIWLLQMLSPKVSRWACSSAVAAALHFHRADFYHPELLRSVVKNPLNRGPLDVATNQLTYMRRAQLERSL